jgi:hypothetical protein
MNPNAEHTVPATVGRPWPAGVSGNPGGRPPGLAKLAREVTFDGVDIVAFFTLVSHGEKPQGWPDAEKLTPEHMIRANEWLADRGLGKATQIIDATSETDARDGALQAVRRMSIEELRAGIEFMQLQEVAAPATGSVQESG